MTAAVRSGRQVVLRTGVALLGGYAFCWGFSVLGIALNFALGLSFHDGEHLYAMLVFLIYPCLFLWAFIARDLRRVAVILFGGGALMTAAASLLQMRIVALAG